jgi:hypothetical protein
VNEPDGCSIQVQSTEHQHQQKVADDTDGLVVLNDRRVADVEFLEQPRTVANTHLRSHEYHRLGHDLEEYKTNKAHLASMNLYATPAARLNACVASTS